jgi:hypothetical protein
MERRDLLLIPAAALSHGTKLLSALAGAGRRPATRAVH